MAVRVALGETQLVQEVRRFLLDNGVCLDSFSQVGALRDAGLNIRGRGQGLEGWVCQRRSSLTLQLSVKVRKIIGSDSWPVGAGWCLLGAGRQDFLHTGWVCV